MDGWRAYSVIAVMLIHWLPSQWRFGLPLEIGLYFFLTLSGFFLTSILLKARAAGELSGLPWRAGAYRDVVTRRLSRVIFPAYAVLIFGTLLQTPDLLKAPWAYWLPWTNFHIAWRDWPACTSHFWTLALQVQFYLFFPLVIFWVPKRCWKWIFYVMLLLAPLCKWYLDKYVPAIKHPEILPCSTMDLFAAGALLSLWKQEQKDLSSWRFKSLFVATSLIYASIYVVNEYDFPINPQLNIWGNLHVTYFRETFLSLALLGVIQATLKGLGSFWIPMLENRVIQKIGQMSYSMYLVHNFAPVVVGWTAHVLLSATPGWKGSLCAITYGWLLGLTCYALTFLTWNFIEKRLKLTR